MHFGQSKCWKQKFIPSYTVSYVLPSSTLPHYCVRYSLIAICEGKDIARKKFIKTLGERYHKTFIAINRSDILRTGENTWRPLKVNIFPIIPLANK